MDIKPISFKWMGIKPIVFKWMAIKSITFKCHVTLLKLIASFAKQRLEIKGALRLSFLVKIIKLDLDVHFVHIKRLLVW